MKKSLILYDDLYRLTDATRPALAAETFGYDKVGNRLSSADYADWSYNNNNALVGYDGVSYTYDANGNTTRKSVSGQDTVFTYSAKDRLEQVNLPDGGIAVYMYDPFGRRVSKTVGGETTYYMYSDEGLAAEMDVSGNVVKSYGWKPNGTWGTDPVLMTEGGNTFFYHNDHLGTPQKMTDAAGSVVWSAVYTAFGEAEVDAASSIINNLRFPGQYYDAETGLHYNWHRYYNPNTGRYISIDPIGLKGGIHLYAYVINNPIKYVDRDGLKLELKPEDYVKIFDKCSKVKNANVSSMQTAQEFWFECRECCQAIKTPFECSSISSCETFCYSYLEAKKERLQKENSSSCAQCHEPSK